MLCTLNKLNNTTFATHFDSFDFSTLYTTILLLECLKSLVEEPIELKELIISQLVTAKHTERTKLS